VSLPMLSWQQSYHRFCHGVYIPAAEACRRALAILSDFRN